MFSPLYSSRPLDLYKNQHPCPLDTGLFIPQKCRKKIRRTEVPVLGWYTYGLSFPNIWKSLPVLTFSRAFDMSAENVDDNYDVLVDKMQIDTSAFGHWLQSCSDTDEVRKVHALVLKSTRDSLPFVDNNLISAYVKFGDLASARGVFDHMLEKNVVTWTAMLNGYQRYGINDEALRLFFEFVNNGFLGNAKTFVCMLNLCSWTFDFELGRQLHACTIKSQLSSLILNSAILHLYARCSDLDGAFHIFDRMRERDVVTWTTMITAYSQHRRGQESFAMFSRMISSGLEPNEFTVSSLLNACGTSLVDMYAKCGEIVDSRTLFDGMKWKNAIAWTSIIAGYARNGLGEDAITLFRVMGRLKEKKCMRRFSRPFL